jgi:hypothetical protein
MSLREDIESIQQRLVKAEADREGWRMTALQEKYLEACSAVDALEWRLAECLREEAAGAASGDDVAPRSPGT